MHKALRLAALPLLTAAALALTLGTADAAARTKKGHHPELTRARTNLEHAKLQLAKTENTYDGHKAKADALIDQALTEVNAAITADDAAAAAAAAAAKTAAKAPAMAATPAAAPATAKAAMPAPAK